MSTSRRPLTAPFGSSPDDVTTVLSHGPPTMRFQPIVDLRDPDLPVVALEALARWPALPHLDLGALFDNASAPALDRLDWTCRLATVRALQRMPDGTVPPLFVNVEPSSSLRPPSTGPGADDDARLWHAADALPLVLELTERHVAHQPAELLQVVAHARDRGWRIALDDVGSHITSLAMIDLVRPDVVKLDVSVIRSDTGRDEARILMDVLAYCERTGATILAEGVETAAQLERARSIGAALGQGWHFGAAGPLRAMDGPLRLPERAVPWAASPFDLLDDQAGMRTARRDVLASFTLDIEQHALDLAEAPIVLAAFQHADGLTPTVRERYARIAARSPFTAMLGAGMPAEPVPGAIGLSLIDGDPLVDEWTVVVVNSHYCAALIARDIGDRGPRREHRFRYTVTQDRDTVTAAARSLLQRSVRTGPRS